MSPPSHYFNPCLTRSRQTKGDGTTDSTKDSTYALGKDAKATTDAAVAEGQRDVEAAKEAGAGYVSQAKDLAASTLAAAQVNYNLTVIEVSSI